MSRYTTVFCAVVMVVGTHSVYAADVPKAGDIELNVSGNIHHSHYSDSYTGYGRAGWFIVDGHQVGGSLVLSRGEYDFQGESDKVTQVGISAFYRYNWFLTGKDYWPYAGVEYLNTHVKSEFKDDLGGDVSTTSTENYWLPVLGVKFMMTDNVALDVNLTRRIDADGDDTSNSNSTDANVGFSIFF